MAYEMQEEPLDLSINKPLDLSASSQSYNMHPQNMGNTPQMGGFFHTMSGLNIEPLPLTDSDPSHDLFSHHSVPSHDLFSLDRQLTDSDPSHDLYSADTQTHDSQNFSGVIEITPEREHIDYEQELLKPFLAPELDYDSEGDVTIEFVWFNTQNDTSSFLVKLENNKVKSAFKFKCSCE